MNNETTLFKGNFISFKKLVNREKGIGGYEFVHEHRCNGNIISILPYKHEPSLVRRDNPYSFLLRYEFTPCWDMDEDVYSSITGGVDEGNTVLETALIELEEESGYVVNESEMIYLGTCFGTKSSDTLYHLFTVDLTGKEPIEITGDGSYLESIASCHWVEDIEIAEDPLVFTSYYLACKRVGIF